MKKTKIIIVVTGGVVSGVRADSDNVAVEIYDTDDKVAEGMTNQEISEELSELGENNYPKVVY